MANTPTSPPPIATTVCDVCQQMQAIVTLERVDYCARCAPMWHPSFDRDDA